MAAANAQGELRLFGIDLVAAARYLRDGWSEALQWRALRWLTPEATVRVVHPDGTESFRRGASSQRVQEQGGARFTALALPEDAVLRRTLVLPRLSRDEVRQAAALDAATASPFPESELVWGFVVDDGDRERIRVDIALTSNKLIESRIAAHREQLKDFRFEVWADGPRPIALPGYAEALREGAMRRTSRTLVALLILAALLAIGLAVTPTLQMRLQAIDADAKLTDLQRRVAAQASLRDQLVRLQEQARRLGAAAQSRPDVLALLDEITRRLPDDAVLSRLEISGSTVRLSGQADNAAQLLQSLGASSGFRDVRAPAGIARAQAGGKESFTIEFNTGPGAKTS